MFAQLPVVTQQPANRTVWLGANANFSVAASGAGPLDYQWQLNGKNLFTNPIAIFAGTGIGDYKAAANSLVRFPHSVAIDSVGNLYLSDGGQYRIRKVDTNGIITTVAGNGTSGYSPDGTAATNASIGMPQGVALDASDSLLFIENQRVRKVDSNGALVTVAGNGYFGFSGDGSAATSASLNGPLGVVTDSAGNVFIADSANHRVRKVDSNGIITTVAGNGLSGFSGDRGSAIDAALNGPSAVGLDKFGNLFIADTQNGRIREVNTNGIITTVAGNGASGYLGDGVPAINASLSWPNGVTIDSSGALLIADTGSQRIRKVDITGVITTFAGNGQQTYAGDGGPGTNGSLSIPEQMTLDTAGNLFIADYGNHRIRKVSADGIITTVVGRATDDMTGDLGPAINVGFWNPLSVTVSPSGELFIADENNHRICKVGPSGTLSVVAGKGTGGYSGDGGAATNAQLYFPNSVAVDVQSNIFIADWQNSRVRKVSFDGIITTVAGNGTLSYSGDGGAATNAGLNGPSGVAIDSAGNLFIADHFNSRIRKMDTNGIIRTVAGGGSKSGDGILATNAALSDPTGIAVGPSGDLLIASFGGNRIRKVSTNGIISTLAGNGTPGYSGDGGAATNATLEQISSVAEDSFGNVFFADYMHHVVRRVSPAGIIETIAGTGIGNYSGDGGPATNATLCNPAGIAVDQFGNLFVADSSNQCVRKVTNTRGPILALNNVSSSDAGDLRVVVTSSSGSQTSRVAVLTVASSPLIYDAARNADNSLTISCVSRPNSMNVLFSTPDLTARSSWQPASTNQSGSDGDCQFTRPSPNNVPIRFYRFLSR